MENDINGVIIVNKNAGVTSHDIVLKIRRLYNTKKVGHTGTLDPMATGVLPILIGRAAKAAEYLVSDSKRYIAGIKLGIETDTEDTTITLEDNISELAKKVLSENVSAIQETYSLIDVKQMTAAMDALSSAKRIVFFGVGTSMLTAMKAMNKFLRIEPKVICNMDANMQLITASTLTDQDVALIFSYSGSTKDTVEIARSAKAAGAKTIVITRFTKSPLTEFADIILLCGANEGTLQNGSTSAEISQLFLVDVMYSEYFRRHYKRCKPNWDKTAHSIADKNY